MLDPQPGLTDVERAKQSIVSAFLRLGNDSFVRSSEADATATANNGDGGGRLLCH